MTIEISSSTEGPKRFSTANIVTPSVNGSMSCRRRGYEDGASLVEPRSIRMPPAAIKTIVQTGYQQRQAPE